MTLKEAVGKVLEGWTLPNAVRKILEEAYFVEPEETQDTLNYTVSVECKRCGSHEKYDLEIDNPQRTWVGLTNEEKNSVWDRAEKRQAYQGVPALMALIQEVEAKLKEKNT